ncbi:hypothetical protein BC832DRAFT_542723 [Gaertneriomyces semiglobifer]|nr:hypothetical protein BC832DRAFT_542723 [Gaertneriomyces semiglobifer]
MKVSSATATLALACVASNVAFAQQQQQQATDAEALAPPTTSPYAHCDKITVRKEIHDMTAADWAVYRSTIQQATRIVDPATKKSLWDTMSDVHLQAASQIHGNAVFLYWHRYFVAWAEQKLQEIDPNFAFPYWAHERQWQTAQYAADPIWDVLGRGIQGAGVKDGVLGGITLNARSYPNSGLRRGFTYPKFDRDLHPAEVYGEIYRRSLQERAEGFARYAKETELYHGTFHVALGGSDKQLGHMSTNNSPSDPAFFLHHANVDKQFADAQLAWAAAGKTDITWHVAGMDYTEKKMTPKTGLPSFPGVTVADVVDIADMCVMYARPGEPVKLPVKPVTTTTTTTSAVATSTTTTTSAVVSTTTTTTSAVVSTTTTTSAVASTIAATSAVPTATGTSAKPATPAIVSPIASSTLPASSSSAASSIVASSSAAATATTEEVSSTTTAAVESTTVSVEETATAPAPQYPGYESPAYPYPGYEVPGYPAPSQDVPVSSAPAEPTPATLSPEETSATAVAPVPENTAVPVPDTDDQTPVYTPPPAYYPPSYEPISILPPPLPDWWIDMSFPKATPEEKAELQQTVQDISKEAIEHVKQGDTPVMPMPKHDQDRGYIGVKQGESGRGEADPSVVSGGSSVGYTSVVGVMAGVVALGWL